MAMVVSRTATARAAATTSGPAGDRRTGTQAAEDRRRESDQRLEVFDVENQVESRPRANPIDGPVPLYLSGSTRRPTG